MTNIGTVHLDALETEGASLPRCIIGHAEGTTNLGYLVEILNRGANIATRLPSFRPGHFQVMKSARDRRRSGRKGY